MTARYMVADVFDGLATLPDGSVDLVVTSPPFLALRSYLPADHPDKGKEIGSEATPAEFIDVMLAVTAELRRVLAPHGSICIELGDTYANTISQDQPDYKASDARKNTRLEMADGRTIQSAGIGNGQARSGTGWPLTKSRTLIPQLYQIGLAYGINPLTGTESPAGRWRIRNVVTWVRPNPPVGALGDKWRPATSDLVVACTSGRRYWDDLATRKPHSEHSLRYYTEDAEYFQRMNSQRGRQKSDGAIPERGDGGYRQEYPVNPSGTPLLDWWELSDSVSPEEMQRRVVIGLQHAFGHDLHPNQARIAKVAVDAMRGQESDASALDWWEIPPGQPVEHDPKVGEQDRSIPELLNHGGHMGTSEAGAPLLDWWNIPPGGYKGSHYAVFPEELVVPCVQAMCPPKVCRTCGKPSRRIVSDPEYVQSRNGVPFSVDEMDFAKGERAATGVNQWLGTGSDASFTKRQQTLGWSDCGHDDWRPGLILDPFAGSGTTLAVATGYGHDAIGIDLDPRNAELALDRVGPFLLEVDLGSSRSTPT